MAGKKAKPRKTTKKLNTENLKPSDVLCPICRTILIEPVTLSCNHAFCKQCFEGTMENANLVCPMCRVRVGSWFRKAKKEGKLIDEGLWEAIQAQYPTEVQNRYQGIDNVIETDVPVIIVATPGEIRKEYEQQRQRELEEQKQIREAEEKASAPLIKKLREEEDQKNRLEEEKLRLDAALARKLSQDLAKPTTSKFTPKKTEIKKVDGNKKYGPMDKFVKTEEAKSNRLSLNKSEERRTLYKGGRKRISTTPNPAIDFATKEYTCHVLNAESRSKDSIIPISIFKKSNCNKPLNTSETVTVQKKIRQARKIIETEERKSICKSGYKSSSGSDDAIDQECRFYFKPIDTQKRYHLPGTVPLKVPSLREKQSLNMHVKPPSGKTIDLQLGTVLSAFARFSMALQQNLHAQSLPPPEVTEDETSDRNVSSSKRLKRKSSDDNSPVKKKGRRQIYTKKNFQYIDDKNTISSPLYGFESESSRVVNSSPFYGFDTLEIKDSSCRKDTIKNLITKQEQKNVIDNNSLVSTEGFYKTFKTYSRHQNRQLKDVPGTSNNDIKSPEEPLRLKISKTPKNGINMSKAIQDKLAELRSSVEMPSDISNKDYKSKTNIDINRNIPEVMLPQPRIGAFGEGKQVGNCWDLSSTKISKKYAGNNADKAVKNLVPQASISTFGSGILVGSNGGSSSARTNSKYIGNSADKAVRNLVSQPSISNFGSGNENSWSSSSARTTLNYVGNSEDKPAQNSLYRCRNFDDCSNNARDMDNFKIGLSNDDNNKLESSSNDSDVILKSMKNDLKDNVDTSVKSKPDIVDAVANCDRSPKARHIRSRKMNIGFKCKNNKSDISDPTNTSDNFNSTETSLKPFNASSSPVRTKLNGSWRGKQRNKSPRKTQIDLSKNDINFSGVESQVVNRISPMTHRMPTSVASTKSEAASSKSTILNDSSSHSVNKVYQAKTKNAETNSKITDTFSKIKSSPTKPKNIKKLKLSPVKTKLYNNIEESVVESDEIDQRHVQEQLDFEMAKKLQAEFDSIQMPSRTRRGTKRQITLDEMLLV